MIAEETVFILGAGASYPYGYPLGRELKDQISKNFYKDLEEMIKTTRGKDSIWYDKLPIAQKFINQLKYPGTPTIDVFLSINPDYQEIGKLAIVFEIMKAEQQSNIINPNKPEEDWYRFLFELMVEDLRTSDSYESFSKNKVTFITFNYDRSLEHFLFECLANRYGMNTDVVGIKKQLDMIPMYHVYGQIDPLPWQGNSSREYNGDLEESEKLSYRDIIARKNIKIIGDSIQMQEFSRVKSKIVNAKKIFFLGFGYDEINLEFLNIPGLLRIGTKIFGTAIGLYPRDKDKITDLLSVKDKSKGGLDASDIILEEINCKELLQKYIF